VGEMLKSYTEFYTGLGCSCSSGEAIDLQWTGMTPSASYASGRTSIKKCTTFRAY